MDTSANIPLAYVSVKLWCHYGATNEASSFVVTDLYEVNSEVVWLQATASRPARFLQSQRERTPSPMLLRLQMLQRKIS